MCRLWLDMFHKTWWFVLDRETAFLELSFRGRACWLLNITLVLCWMMHSLCRRVMPSRVTWLQLWCFTTITGHAMWFGVAVVFGRHVF